MILLLLCLAAPQDTVSPPGRATLEPGVDLRLDQADRALARVHEPVPGASPNVHERRATIDWTEECDFGGLTERFVAVTRAWLEIGTPGRHEFRLTSDDGSMLFLDGKRIAWNPDVHAPRPKEGGVPSTFAQRAPRPPALWLPQGEIGMPPSGMVFAAPDGPFAGQVLIGDVKLGGIRRAFFEEVEGQKQGAVFRFCQGFEGGTNRLLWAPDGSLVVEMIGESASWSWRQTKTGLQRLVPTGEETFEFHSMSASETGVTLRFTETVDAALAADPARYQMRHWRDRATPGYGGPSSTRPTSPSTNRGSRRTDEASSSRFRA